MWSAVNAVFVRDPESVPWAFDFPLLRRAGEGYIPVAPEEDGSREAGSVGLRLRRAGAPGAAALAVEDARGEARFRLSEGRRETPKRSGSTADPL